MILKIILNASRRPCGAAQCRDNSSLQSILKEESRSKDQKMRLFSTKNLYRFHAYAGLWLGAHFMVLVITGFLLLFKPTPEFKSTSAVSAETPAPSYTRIVGEAGARFPGERLLSLFPDEENARVLHLRLSPDGSGRFRNARKLSFDLATGAELMSSVSETGFFPFLLRLHRDLLFGSTGKILVGISGALLFLMLITGFLIYGRFRRGQAYDSIRFGSKPLVLADIHKWISSAAGVWLLLVSFTGVLLAFNSLLIKLYQYQNLKSLSLSYAGERTAETNAPLDLVIGNALGARPGAALEFLAFPGTEFSLPGHYLLLLNRTTSFGGHVRELAVVEAATAKIAEVRELPLYLKALLLSEPLHFGDYGGLTLKILWGAFAVVSFVMAIVGIWGWFAKRKHRRTPREKIRPKLLPIVKAKYPRYLAPILLGSFTLSGALLALFSEGFGDWLAYGLFAVPLAVLIYSGIKRFTEVRVGRG
ncbi:MAG: hypothetical protein EOP11_07180 [Proteobacteria bacterium]|nr:MAG: hypothetical protein EOP11_07180 [Pseudomonadota bacterium]